MQERFMLRHQGGT